MSKEDIMKKFGDKYYEIDSQGEYIVRDKSREEKQAKKAAQSIEKLHKKSQKERNIEVLEGILEEIKELLDEIIHAAKFSKSQSTLSSLKNSKHIFKVNSCRLLESYLYQVAIICERLISEDISRDSLGFIKVRLDSLMNKVAGIQKGIDSVGETLLSETEQRLEAARKALKNSMEIVESRAKSREIKDLLEGGRSSERAYRLHIADQIHNAGYRSPMSELDIDVPVDDSLGTTRPDSVGTNSSVDIDFFE